MNAATENAESGSRARLILVIIIEAVVLTAAAIAMIVFDLGWIGAVGMALLVAGRHTGSQEVTR